MTTTEELVDQLENRQLKKAFSQMLKHIRKEQTEQPLTPHELEELRHNDPWFANNWHHYSNDELRQAYINSQQPPINKETLLTADQLRKIVHYNPETGIFTRLQTQGYPGRQTPLSERNPKRYRTISINNTAYMEHRVAWLYVTGEWPPQEMVVDHKNNHRGDNRLENLRLATPRQNTWNVPHKPRGPHNPYRGVTWDDTLELWWSKIHIEVNKPPKIIGYYKTAEEARDAWNEAAKAQRGEFHRT